MDFEPSEDELALAEGMRRLLAGRFGLERLRRAEGETTVVDPTAWSELAEAGVFALRVPEAEGGLGLPLATTAMVFEELGRALVPGPLLPSHLAAGLVAGAAEGVVVVGSARPRPGAGQPWQPGGSNAVAPVVVEHLAVLGALVVVEEDRLGLLDPAELDGALPVARPLDPLTPLWCVDALPGGETVGGPAEAARWRREERVLGGALLVGLAAAATDLAVAYAQDREQFGRPIGSFQAVKHLCADMVVRAEVARAAVHAAAVTVDQPDVGDAERAAAGAALLAGEAAVANGRSCIQVHGGMGFTWEIPAHLYLMRARVLVAGLEGAGRLAEVVAQRF
ncbi:MAG TPA: acyl-CoA dehydrogenase family protein [Acidimicrobiales bacterium]|nr:acyl-CoA dehydrogenase family protein [Acidimicrobiales bacterium]